MKRPACADLASDAPAKRRRIISRQCAEVAAALRQASVVPKPVAEMLSTIVSCSLSLCKADRHSTQRKIVDMMGDVLEAERFKLRKVCAEFFAHFDARSTVITGETAIQAAQTRFAELKILTGEASSKILQCKADWKSAASRLAVVVRKSRDTENQKNALLKQRCKLQAAFDNVYTPLKAKGLEAGASHLMSLQTTARRVLGFQHPRVVSEALRKPPAERGPFDNIVVEELEVAFAKKIDALSDPSSDDPMAEESRADEEEKVAGPLRSEVEACKASIDAARKAWQEASKVESAAASALKKLKLATMRLQAFETGPWAAFKALRVLRPPGQTANILEHIKILPHGVLGAQMRLNKRVVKRRDEPDSETAFVDPAGLHHLQPPGGPAGAGGAARAIYKFLGISREDRFPQVVIDAVKRVGDAKYHKYGPDKHTIHAIGPDLRGLYSSDGSRKEEPEPPSLDQALEELSDAYGNILQEFISSSLPTLWLLPVSSGIFSGAFKEEMPFMTMTALQKGFARCLPADRQEILLTKDLNLCIFEERELQIFQDALRDVSQSVMNPCSGAV